VKDANESILGVEANWRKKLASAVSVDYLPLFG
jgi:hypothetical protein